MFPALPNRQDYASPVPRPPAVSSAIKAAPAPWPERVSAEKIAEGLKAPALREDTATVSRAAFMAQRPHLEPASPAASSTTTARQSTAAYYESLKPLIADVQQVAERVGLIDVRAEDVIRAKSYGESLFADYTV